MEIILLALHIDTPQNYTISGRKWNILYYLPLWHKCVKTLKLRQQSAITWRNQMLQRAVGYWICKVVRTTWRCRPALARWSSLWKDQHLWIRLVFLHRNSIYRHQLQHSGVWWREIFTLVLGSLVEEISRLNLDLETKNDTTPWLSEATVWCKTRGIINLRLDWYVCFILEF